MASNPNNVDEMLKLAKKMVKKSAKKVKAGAGALAAEAPKLVPEVAADVVSPTAKAKKKAVKPPIEVKPNLLPPTPPTPKKSPKRIKASEEPISDPLTAQVEPAKKTVKPKAKKAKTEEAPPKLRDKAEAVASFTGDDNNKVVGLLEDQIEVSKKIEKNLEKALKAKPKKRAAKKVETPKKEAEAKKPSQREIQREEARKRREEREQERQAAKEKRKTEMDERDNKRKERDKDLSDRRSKRDAEIEKRKQEREQLKQQRLQRTKQREEEKAQKAEERQQKDKQRLIDREHRNRERAHRESERQLIKQQHRIERQHKTAEGKINQLFNGNPVVAGLTSLSSALIRRQRNKALGGPTTDGAEAKSAGTEQAGTDNKTNLANDITIANALKGLFGNKSLVTTLIGGFMEIALPLIIAGSLTAIAVKFKKGWDKGKDEAGIKEGEDPNIEQRQIQAIEGADTAVNELGLNFFDSDEAKENQRKQKEKEIAELKKLSDAKKANDQWVKDNVKPKPEKPEVKTVMNLDELGKASTLSTYDKSQAPPSDKDLKPSALSGHLDLDREPGHQLGTGQNTAESTPSSISPQLQSMDALVPPPAAPTTATQVGNTSMVAKAAGLVNATAPKKKEPTKTPKDLDLDKVMHAIMIQEGFLKVKKDKDGKPVEEYNKGSLAYRNFNPGNLVYTKKLGELYGAKPNKVTGKDGKERVYAKFPSLEKGMAAMKALLQRRVESGLTLRELIGGQRDEKGNVKPGGYPGYAPAQDNNPVEKYVEGVQKNTGLEPDAPIAKQLSPPGAPVETAALQSPKPVVEVQKTGREMNALSIATQPTNGGQTKTPPPVIAQTTTNNNVQNTNIGSGIHPRSQESTLQLVNIGQWVNT